VGLYAGLDAAPYSAPFWSVGASVELPVVQRNQGPLAINTRERESEQARLELARRRVEREVMAAFSAYDARRAELRILVDEALPAASRNLDLIEMGWRSGRFDIFRVTAAARDLVRVKAMRLEALEAAWVERIALERAAGGWPR
jgi:outer membrane protein TolC